MRRPEAMVKGTPYHRSCKRDEQICQQKDWRGRVQDISHEDFQMVFYTYMPYQYDNKDDAYFAAKNKDIKNGKNLRVVFYGKIAGSVGLELLEDGQGKV